MLCKDFGIGTPFASSGKLFANSNDLFANLGLIPDFEALRLFALEAYLKLGFRLTFLAKF
jgi:hypothetical protein